MMDRKGEGARTGQSPCNRCLLLKFPHSFGWSLFLTIIPHIVVGHAPMRNSPTHLFHHSPSPPSSTSASASTAQARLTIVYTPALALRRSHRLL